ncbi:hypothetical protein PEL8287_03952 [Roseovarius litorisediminis]|uniref:Uncharacterized protein n=1 Tax=Roseovarius litorisediminis TaxID=1312363 RepID=A0A1Y5TYB5_9RHOB|nr:hypothetical protein PEL8287_03952 [Roseovarius litorisediminis]
MEVGRQGGFGVLPAEDAVFRGTGNGDADVGAVFRHEDAHQGKPRGGLLELHVGRGIRHRELHLGDDLAFVQRGFKQPLEKVIRRDLAGVGHDGGRTCQSRRRVAGRGVVVGQATAEGAAIAHRRITDVASQPCQRGIGAGAGSHLGVGGGRADTKRVIVGAADAADLFNAAQADQAIRRGQPLFQGGDQGLPPAQGLAVGGIVEQFHRIGQTCRAFNLKCIHGLFLPKLGGMVFLRPCFFLL